MDAECYCFPIQTQFQVKKYIVLSVNDNPDYLYFTPLTEWAWRKFGWEPILFFAGELTPMVKHVLFDGDEPSTRAFMVGNVQYRTATIAQISRLYAGVLVQPDDYVMTGDIDMIPLSDYWHPNFDQKTVWGFDLTGRTEFPICYLGMKAKYWREVMRLDSDNYSHKIKRDLDSMPNAKSEDFYKWWGVDQQLITERLKPYNPTIIERGQYPNGYAYGRVDRGSWTLDHKEYIDAHLPQQVYHRGREKYFEQMMELLHHVWPEEDFTWVYDYTIEFRKLTGHA